MRGNTDENNSEYEHFLPGEKETAYLATLTEGILNGRLHFLCSEQYKLNKANLT